MIQVSDDLFIAETLHGETVRRYPPFYKRSDLLHKSLLQHGIHTLIDPIIDHGAIPVQDKISRIKCRLP